MNDSRMPPGEQQPACRPMKECGTRTAVTDTYGADLSGEATNGMSGMTGGEIVTPAAPRMEDCHGSKA